MAGGGLYFVAEHRHRGKDGVRFSFLFHLEKNLQSVDSDEGDFSYPDVANRSGREADSPTR